jgi:hypothetical protein
MNREILLARQPISANSLTVEKRFKCSPTRRTSGKALKQRQTIFEISLMSADTQHWLRRYLRLSWFYQTFAAATASSFAFVIVDSISAGAARVGST